MTGFYDAWDAQDEQRKGPSGGTSAPKPSKPVEGTRDRRYGLTAMRDECDRVANTAQGGRNDQLNRSAYNLGQLVFEGLLGATEIVEELRLAARACGLPAAEAEATIRSGARKGYEDGRGARVPDMTGEPGDVDVTWADKGTGADLSASDADPDVDEPTPEEQEQARQERAEKAFEAAVAEEIRRIEAREEARRRVTAGDWVEPEAPIMWAEDIVALDIPPLQPRIDQLMFEDGTAVLVGERKVGKTSMLLHLARCLAEGEPVLGKYEVTVPDGSITILDYEMSLRQGRDWIEKISIETPRRVNGLYLRKMANPLATEAGRKWLTESLKRMETQVLLADPLAVMFSTLVEKEGDNSGLRRAFHMLEEICGDAGVREMVVAAHAGKDLEKGARGGSSIEDWPDTVMRLEKGTPEEGETEEPRHFMAMGRDVDIPWMQLTWDWDGRRIGVAHENMRPIKPKRGRAGRSDSDIKQEIFDYMKGTTQPASTNAIQGQVTGDDKRISAMIRELVDMGVLTSDPTWTKKTAAPWVMVEAAKKVNNPSEYEAG